MARNTDGITEFIFGLLLGGVIGAGTALLLAPAKGKDTRDIISNKLQGIIEEGREELDTVQDIVHQEIVKLTAQKDAVRKAIDEGVKAYKEQKAAPEAEEV